MTISKRASSTALGPTTWAKRRQLGFALLLATSICVAGCVSPPPPRELDLSRALIVSAPIDLKADLANIGDRAAGKGAGGGAATGLATGALACAPTLFLYPLCLVLAAGVGAGVGAATGGAVGRVARDDEKVVAERRAGMIDELQSAKRQTALVLEVQRRLRDDSARDLQLIDNAPDSASSTAAAIALRPWQVEVGLTLIGAEGGSRSFALHLEATARVRTRADGIVVYTTDKEVKSETELDVTGWLASDGRALRGVLDRCVAQVARNLAADLVQPPYDIRLATPPPRQAKRFSSCDDEPDDWRPPAAR